MYPNQPPQPPQRGWKTWQKVLLWAGIAFTAIVVGLIGLGTAAVLMGGVSTTEPVAEETTKSEPVEPEEAPKPEPEPKPEPKPEPEPEPEPEPAPEVEEELSPEMENQIFVTYVRENTTTLDAISDDMIVDTAFSVCSQLDSGVPLEEFAISILAEADNEAQRDDLMFLVGSSIGFYCDYHLDETTGTGV